MTILHLADTLYLHLANSLHVTPCSHLILYISTLQTGFAILEGGCTTLKNEVCRLLFNRMIVLLKTMMMTYPQVSIMMKNVMMTVMIEMMTIMILITVGQHNDEECD